MVQRKKENRSAIKKGSVHPQHCFVIHKHEATHLHFDLRLEVGGKLICWALPKKPTFQKGEKHLAIKVEDHPLSYMNFEGEIPKEKYGAGHVEIWDTGKFIPILKRVDSSSRKSKNTEQKIQDEIQTGVFSFLLLGQKIRGRFVLIRTDEEKKTWIIQKKQIENEN